MIHDRGKGGSARSCDALLKRVENNDPNLKELVILPIKSFGKVEASRLAKGRNGPIQIVD